MVAAPPAGQPAAGWETATRIENGRVHARAVGYIPLTPLQCWTAVTDPGARCCARLDGCGALGAAREAA